MRDKSENQGGADPAKRDPAAAVPVPPSLRRALPRTLVRLAVIIALAVLFHAILGGLMMRINDAGDQPVMLSLLIVVLVGYAVLIAIPFMPGIEVGIALLLLQGAAVAPFVYLATITGLALAYTVGSLVPLRVLHNAFRDLHLQRACQLIDDIQTTPRNERLARLQNRLPAPVAKLAVNYRYVMIGLLINIPGTFAIGGGGGIMMLAGIVRLFHWPAIVLTLALATLPIPLAVYLYGADSLRSYFG